MFEALKRTDRFSTLLLPVDANNSIDHTSSSYNLCLNMYHSFGAIILTVFTSTATTTMFPICKVPQDQQDSSHSQRSKQQLGSIMEYSS
eukprot:scaffold602248_cov67-Attheya_sp.AAC.3